MQIRVIIVVLKGSQVVCGQRFHQALGSQLVTAFVYLPLNNAQGELQCKVRPQTSQQNQQQWLGLFRPNL